MKKIIYAILFLIFSANFAIAEQVENRILFLGDSLTTGYRINKKDAFPQLLENKFKDEEYSIESINSGVSGSTSASGLGRLKWLMQLKPTHLVLGLGANDGLRGQSIKALRSNLQKTIEFAKDNNLEVILLGMRIPTNYGIKYTKDFFDSYKLIANANDITLVPFLLENVAGNINLNLDDGIHPNEAGHKILAENIYPYLKKKITK